MNRSRTPIPRVKICCISSREEAHMAIQAGADALGLVARMPSGPGPIPDELIADIASTVPPPIATFLLTSETAAQAIIREQLRIPVFLAGGLHAGNVRRAIEAVEPFGIDLCTGVRTNGKLDPEKLEAFFRAIFG